MPQNPGRLPPECVLESEAGVITYRNVHVRLFGGYDSKKAGAAPWPAGGGRPPTRWSVSRVPHPFDIRAWELA